MLSSRSGILADAINTNIITKNYPDSVYSHPDSYLNINSIRNKFGDLDKIVDGNTDILCIAATKLG